MGQRHAERRFLGVWWIMVKGPGLMTESGDGSFVRRESVMAEVREGAVGATLPPWTLGKEGGYIYKAQKNVTIAIGRSFNSSGCSGCSSFVAHLGKVFRNSFRQLNFLNSEGNLELNLLRKY